LIAVFAVTKTPFWKREAAAFLEFSNMAKCKKQQYDYRCGKEHHSTRGSVKKINRAVWNCHRRAKLLLPVGMEA
jgi:hypothetical protein